MVPCVLLTVLCMSVCVAAQVQILAETAHAQNEPDSKKCPSCVVNYTTTIIWRVRLQDGGVRRKTRKSKSQLGIEADSLPHLGA